MLDLGQEQFPLYAIGALIYGRMNSSPVLTAASPQIAMQTVYLLNKAAMQWEKAPSHHYVLGV